MNEKAIEATCEYLMALALVSVSNSQKVDAIEQLLKKRPEFAEGYRQELERAKARAQQSGIAEGLDKLRLALRQI